MRRNILLCALLVTATFAAFHSVRLNGFIVFDDPQYITNNQHVNGGLTAENLHWAFTTAHASNWHPVTWISHMLDVSLFGMNASGHHIVSVAIHAVNAALLFFVLLSLTDSCERLERSQARAEGALSKYATVWCCFFIAALFALHPLRVESVAWVSERKDVLSGFFFMLTLLTYGGYVTQRRRDADLTTKNAKNRERARGSKFDVQSSEFEVRVPSQSPKSYVPTPTSPPSVLGPMSFYVLSLIFFALGLMSKPMLVTVPFVLLLLDFWPLKRLDCYSLSSWKRVLPEKTPFFALTLMTVVLTFYAQHRGQAVAALEVVPFGLRIQNAIVAYAAYVQDTFWPANLAVYYPLRSSIQWEHMLVCVLLLAAITWFAVRSVQNRPWIAFGWFLFVGMLVPVIGIVQVGGQARADRYTYLPQIGLFIAIIVTVYEAVASKTNMRTSEPVLRFLPASLYAVLALAAAACFMLTTRQVHLWRDSITLFQHAIKLAPNSPIARVNLGNALMNTGQLSQASGHFREAARLMPGYAEAWNNLGFSLSMQGQVDEAIACYRTTLSINPRLAATRALLAGALLGRGNHEEAIQEYWRTLDIDPNWPPALNDLAWIMATHEDPAVRNGSEAVLLAERACKATDYKNPLFIGTLAAAYAELGKFPEAVQIAEQARKLAANSGLENVADRNRDLLELYRSGKPCRE